MFYQVCIELEDGEAHLLDEDQVLKLQTLGFKGFEQRKTYQEFYMPSNREVRAEVSLKELQELSDDFQVELHKYGVTLTPR